MSNSDDISDKAPGPVMLDKATGHAAGAVVPKNQLSRRVAARISELEEILERLGDEPANQKRRGAIVEALKAAHSSMRLDAERMSHMEASLMTRWIESTQYLILPIS